MRIDYLNDFQNLFFDIDSDKNDNILKIVKQSEFVLSSVIYKFGEIVNEISNGISVEGKLNDIIVCLFVRKFMEQLDAINILMRKGSFAPAQILLRTYIENIVSLKFILKDDTDRRAASYWLEHHFQEISMWTNNLENIEEKMIATGDVEKFEKKKAALQRIVDSNDLYKEIANSREKKLEKKPPKRKYIQWYEVCSNVSSFKKMMTDVGMEKYYESIYGGLSFESHSFNSTMDISVSNENFNLNPIRKPVEGETLLSLACIFSMSVLIDVYSYLGDKENEKEEFRQYFLEFKEKRTIAENNLNKIH